VTPEPVWEKVESLLDRALDLPEEEREAFVEAACSDDPALRRKLLDLLAAAGRETALDRPIASLAPELVEGATARLSGAGELSPGALLGAYRILSLLGAGGMGQVYLAERADGQFERRVALKVLGGSRMGGAGRDRFLRERQILADLRHAHIAQLLDAGIAPDGRPYFVLEHVDGEPVTEYCRRGRLDREARVALVLQACEALAYAHARGVVHRDLKPANLLVAAGADGRPHLFVLDFGIARAGDAAELTRTGDVIGTPGYMAPEQARGEVETVDRRADVFALGVLLYELLCDRRPFDGATPGEVLGAVLASDPASPRTLVPGFPRDLETILLACLEKRPERRYDSARALAADLASYLAGEPIAARRPGLGQRLARTARRRPLAFASLLALAASMAAGGAVGVREQRIARERAELARRFAAEAERVTALQRFEQLAPLHDATPARARLAARLSALERELDSVDPAARPAGWLALGRGRLALGELTAALGALERAWEGGLRTPEAALAFASAETEHYRRERAEAERIADPALRATRLDALARRSRDRAHELARLAREGATGAEGALVRARLAFLEGELERAAELARSARAEAPWLYEASLLAGDVELTRVGELRRAGELARIGEPLERALEAYDAAAAVGRSDPEAHLRICAAAATALDLALHAISTEPDRFEAAGATGCRAAVRADPGSVEPHVQESALETVYARELSRRDRDPFPAVAAAAAAAERALALDPGSATALRRLGDSYSFRAEFERERGIDSAASITAATVALARAAELEPGDAGIWNSLGLAHWEALLHALERERDFVPAARAAAEAFARAVAIEPGYAYAWGNLGSMRNKLAEAAMLAGGDPAPELEAAAHAFARALEIYPEYTTAVNNLGNVLYNLGEIRYARDEDARAEYERALRQFDRAAALKPDWFVPRVNQARAGLALAQAQVRRREAPDAAVARAQADLEAGLALRGSHVQAQVLAGEIQLFRAERARRAGAAVEPALRAVRTALARVRQVDPDAGAELARALAAFERGEPSGLYPSSLP